MSVQINLLTNSLFFTKCEVFLSSMSLNPYIRFMLHALAKKADIDKWKINP